MSNLNEIIVYFLCRGSCDVNMHVVVMTSICITSVYVYIHACGIVYTGNAILLPGDDFVQVSFQL